MPESAARRPPKELKGFARVVLDPGERKTIAIPLRIPDLAYWDAEAHAWVVEETIYEVKVGANDRDLSLSGSFRVGPVGIPLEEGGE